MSMSFRIALPPVPADLDRGRIALAKYSQHVLNALARINADWVLDQWARGKQPPCCAKCGGVRYVPDLELGNQMPLDSSATLLITKRASCGSIAACHTGHKIAEAVEGKFKGPNGMELPPMAWDEACSRFFVLMGDGPDPRKPMLLHALCSDDGRVLDPTEGMIR